MEYLPNILASSTEKSRNNEPPAAKKAKVFFRCFLSDRGGFVILSRSAPPNLPSVAAGGAMVEIPSARGASQVANTRITQLSIIYRGFFYIPNI